MIKSNGVIDLSHHSFTQEIYMDKKKQALEILVWSILRTLGLGFFARRVNGFKPSTIVTKKLHHRWFTYVLNTSSFSWGWEHHLSGVDREKFLKSICVAPLKVLSKIVCFSYFNFDMFTSSKKLWIDASCRTEILSLCHADFLFVYYGTPVQYCICFVKF